jgi:hypothetical protein
MITGEVQGLRLAAEKLHKLLVDYLNNLLSRGEALEDVRGKTLLLDGGHELLDDLEVDIGLKQRQTHFSQCFVYILFRKLALAPKLFENVSQA